MGLVTQLMVGVFEPVTATRSLALENPNLPLNSPGVWEEVFGETLRTHSGEKLSHNKALSYAPVYQAVGCISADIAKMPLMMYRTTNGVRDEVEDSPLTELVQILPNREEHAFKFWRRFMVHALLWNNAYAFIQRDGNDEPVELLHLLPDRTAMERHDGELWCITEISDEGGGRKLHAIPAKDVLHVEGISIDCMDGGDLVEWARHSWGLGLAQEKFASMFFKNGGRIGGILELPAGISKQAKDNVEEGFIKSYGGADNPFRTVILRDNAKFHAAQQSPQESQLVEASESQVRQVARWFNLAPSKLGLSDSVSYNSKAEDNQAYLDSTLSPWLKQIDMECTVKLLSAKQRRKFWFEHETTALLRMNAVQRSLFYQQMIAATVINPNEARRMENLPPYEGGEKFANPNTSAPESVEKEEETPPEPAKTEEKPTETPAKREINHALARVVFHIGSNARHKALRPSAFIEWVDGGMVSHKEESRSLLGDDAHVQLILTDLKTLADTLSAEKLPDGVNELMSNYERDCYGTA